MDESVSGTDGSAFAMGSHEFMILEKKMVFCLQRYGCCTYFRSLLVWLGQLELRRREVVCFAFVNTIAVVRRSTQHSHLLLSWSKVR